MTTIGGTETLVPYRHPRTLGRIVALAGVLVPPCVVALAVALDGGDLFPAAVLTGLVLVCAVLAAGIAVASRVDLVPGGLRNHRLAHERDIRGDRVAKAVVRRIRNLDELTSDRHLFLLDIYGRTMFRMSNRWWTDAQIAKVVTHLAVPVEGSDEVLHPSELRRAARRQLNARERHPVAWFAGVVCVTCVVSVIVAGLTTASL